MVLFSASSGQSLGLSSSALSNVVSDCSYSFEVSSSFFYSSNQSSSVTPPKPKKAEATKQGSFHRISVSDLSNLNNPSLTLTEDLSVSLAGSNLHLFTLAELKIITQNFSSSNFLSEGEFGQVHKGLIDDKLQPGLEAQTVAIKLLNLDGTQSHK